MPDPWVEPSPDQLQRLFDWLKFTKRPDYTIPLGGDVNLSPWDEFVSSNPKASPLNPPPLETNTADKLWAKLNPTGQRIVGNMTGFDPIEVPPALRANIPFIGSVGTPSPPATSPIMPTSPSIKPRISIGGKIGKGLGGLGLVGGAAFGLVGILDLIDKLRGNESSSFSIPPVFNGTVSSNDVLKTGSRGISSEQGQLAMKVEEAKINQAFQQGILTPDERDEALRQLSQAVQSAYSQENTRKEIEQEIARLETIKKVAGSSPFLANKWTPELQSQYETLKFGNYTIDRGQIIPKPKTTLKMGSQVGTGGQNSFQQEGQLINPDTLKTAVFANQTPVIQQVYKDWVMQGGSGAPKDFVQHLEDIGFNPPPIGGIAAGGNQGLAQSQGVGNYTVKQGDNLWDIATKVYGNGQKWKDIYAVNKDVIGGNPNLIYAGQQYNLPGIANTEQNAASPQLPTQATVQPQPTTATSTQTTTPTYNDPNKRIASTTNFTFPVTLNAVVPTGKNRQPIHLDNPSMDIWKNSVINGEKLIVQLPLKNDQTGVVTRTPALFDFSTVDPNWRQAAWDEFRKELLPQIEKLDWRNQNAPSKNTP